MPSSSTFADSLLYIRDGYETARWNFPDAIGTSRDDPGGIGNPATVSFTFLKSVPSYDSTTGFRAFNGTEQAAARQALDSWSAVARITFQETTGVGDVTFGMDAQAGTSGYAYAPAYGYSYDGAGVIQSVTKSKQGGDVWLDSTTAWAADDFAPGGFGLQTLIHEVGHAIGLKHSFESDNGGTVLDAALDHKGWTVMSYTEHPHGLFRTVVDKGASWTISYEYIQPETPMIGDIAAAQVLYGANKSWHAGNDTYTFDPGRPFLQTIWDGGGTDTISVSNFSQGCVINLNAGSFSTIRILSDALPPGATETHDDIYDGTDNLGIAYSVTIENAKGGSGADTLRGNGAANALTGNGGNDTLDGGSGADLMTGGSGNDTYVIDNTGDQAIELAEGGNDLVKSSITWTLGAELERLTLTGSSAVNATGNGKANTLTGNGANNVLNGGKGGDTMSGGAGNDTYVVENTGDLVSEATSGGSDLVKSSVGWTLGAELEKLTLTGSAAVNGKGNGLANVLVGNEANNTLTGAAGSDTLTGGGGADTFVLNSTSGADTLTDFTTGSDRVRVTQSALAVGDGDTSLEGAVRIAGPGGFARTAELVIVTANIAGSITGSSAAAKIGSASSAYAVGATALFAVDNGSSSALYLFEARDADAAVEANELTLLATLSGTPSTATGDYVFG